MQGKGTKERGKSAGQLINPADVAINELRRPASHSVIQSVTQPVSQPENP